MAETEASVQMKTSTRLSKLTPAKKSERDARARLIRKARGGDEKAIAELRERHKITKVWTEEEMAAYKRK